MFAAVVAASPGTKNLPAAIKANMLVAIVSNQKTPALLAMDCGDGSAGSWVFTFVVMFLWLAGLDRSAVTTEPDRRGDADRREDESDPEARGDKKFQRLELREPIDHRGMR